MSKLAHALIVILVFIIAVAVVLIIYRPDLVEKWWLWAIGLGASAAGWLREGWDRLKKKYLSQ